MSLHRLLFDPTAPDDTSNVGAYLRDSAGNLIDSTDVGGKQSLDVNVTALTAADIDIRDLAHTQDSVRLGDGTTLFTGTTVGPATGLDVNLINASITVDATDLDIRDLSASQDSVAISDGTDTLGVNADGSINSVVTATDLDIRDLTAATDSVAAWTHDGSGNAIGSTGGSLDVNVTNDIDVNDGLMNTAVAASAETVTTTSAKLITSDLADRKNIWLYNNGNKPVYVGPSGVTAETGFPLFPGSILPAEFGAAVAIHAESASGSQDIRVLQGS